MAKQYYNLEEAAEALGIGTEQLNAMRERGDVRAFADRGTWKFRVSDIDQLAQQGASAEDSALADESDDAQVLLSEQEVGSSDSSFPSTVIGMGPEYGSPSDSDVRLIPDAAGAGSDSDVKLVSEDQAGSDSDVKINEPASAVSDSDVRLSEMLPEAPTQQDDAGSDFELSLGDSDLGPQGPDSGDAGDSLVLGEVADSEISIAPSDSGISLGTPSDSGISLEQPPSAADTETIPAGGGEELLETDFEVPVLDESGVEETDLDLGDSDFDLSDVGEAPSDSGTQVIAVEGDEADSAAATTVADTSSAILAEVGASGVEAVEPYDEVEAAPMEVEEAAAARPVLRTQETEWSKLVFAGLLLTSVLALFATFMMLDLVRNLWTEHEPLQISSWLMDQIVGK